MKNQLFITVTVYKEGDANFHYGGLPRMISCEHQVVLDEGLSLVRFASQCGYSIPAGTERADPNNPTGQTEVIKIRDDNGQFLWVDKTSYNAQIANCNKCCGAQVCPLTISMVASAITSSGVTINWPAVSSSNMAVAGYEWIVNTSSSAPVINGTFRADNSALVITGLTTGTAYHFWIRTICASGQSAWNSLIFTTT